MSENERVNRWYFGGVSSSIAVFVTHPLDLLKVLRQVDTVKRHNLFQLGNEIVRKNGISALYSGLPASILRQMTSTASRFGVYEIIKQDYAKKQKQFNFVDKIYSATLGGLVAGFLGAPADVINVRMQNDSRRQIRRYKNLPDAFYKIYKIGGIGDFFRGASFASSRAIFITIAQLVSYDEVKCRIMNFSTFFSNDSIFTHLSASFISGLLASFVTMPFDVMKTRVMNLESSEKSSNKFMLATKGLRLTGLFKGYVPSLIRIGPHTVVTFVLMEQLRIYFGKHVKQ